MTWNSISAMQKPLLVVPDVKSLEYSNIDLKKHICSDSVGKYLSSYKEIASSPYWYQSHELHLEPVINKWSQAPLPPPLP